MLQLGGVRDNCLDSTTLSIECVDHLELGIVEAPLGEVLLGALLVLILNQVRSRAPFLNIIDKMMMPEPFLLTDAEELAEDLVV